MGRFNAAKMLGATDSSFQAKYNTLIDLLDTGYMTEAIIAGKKVNVSINPKDGIVIKVDGVKVFGVDSAGNVYVQRISNTTDNSYYAEFGYGASAGFAMYMPDGSGGVIRYMNIAPTVSGGFTFIDRYDKTRFQITADGSFTMWDASGNAVLWISNDGNFSQLHTASAVDNAIGVDDTGGYVIVGGSKLYLSAIFAPIAPSGSYATEANAIAYAIALG